MCILLQQLEFFLVEKELPEVQICSAFSFVGEQIVQWKLKFQSACFILPLVSLRTPVPSALLAEG